MNTAIRTRMQSRRGSRKIAQRKLRLEMLEHRIVFAGDSPVALNDVYLASSGETLEVAASGVLANDQDAEADALTAMEYRGPEHGTLELNSDGSFLYQPNPGFEGLDSFLYRAYDGASSSMLAAVTIHVTGENTAPTAADDGFEVNEDEVLEVGASQGVLANDDDGNGDSLIGSIVSGPSHGTLTLNANGSFQYIPELNFNGTDSFVYSATDGSAEVEATVTIDVRAVNDAPVTANDQYTLDEDEVLEIAATGVLANDRDLDGDPLTSIIFAMPEHGTVALNPDGSFSYTPAADFNGSDSFMYRTTDGSLLSDIAVVEMTVIAVNDAPIAANDQYVTDEETALIVAAAGVMVNDSDVEGDALSAVLDVGPEHGTLTLNADGSFEYIPAPNFSGTDSFTYRAFDGALHSEIAVVELAINAVNDVPIAANDQYATDEDTALIVPALGVLANDTDVDGDAISPVLVAMPEHGTLVLNPDGSFTYTPAVNFHGTDSFTYRVSDETLQSEVAVVELTVNPVNDVPLAANDEYSTDKNVALVIAAPGTLGNDSDADGDPLAVAVEAGPEHGTLTLNSDGSFTYTPEADFAGTDSFTYQANDGTAFSIATVNITVNNPNARPTAVNESYNVVSDSTLNVNAATGVLANDSDSDGDTLTANLHRGPTHGSLTLNSDGSFAYVPNAGFNGVDSFVYRTSDGNLVSSLAAVTIHVLPLPSLTASERTLAVGKASEQAVDAILDQLNSPTSTSTISVLDGATVLEESQLGKILGAIDLDTLLEIQNRRLQQSR